MRNLILGVIAVLLVVGIVGCTQNTPTGNFVKVGQGSETGSGTSCIDSDNGKIKDVKGTATGIDANGESYSKSDECVKGAFLIEYYCDGNAVANYNYNCNCKEGACQE